MHREISEEVYERFSSRSLGVISERNSRIIFEENCEGIFETIHRRRFLKNSEEIQRGFTIAVLGEIS